MKSKVKPMQRADIRQRVEKKFKARRDLAQHLAVYLVVNSLLWLVWSFWTSPFPWPVFASGFWGIGLVSHYIDFHYRHGRGAEIESEVTRQMRAAQGRKSKMAADYADGDVFDLGRIEARRLRLKADGELNDSLIEEADYDEERAGR